MSTLRIEERITVSAPVARVWKLMLDPARIAACLPGASLDGDEGESTYLGTMKVKVGPVVMSFKGKATMTEVVVEERRITLTGTGSDKSGGGTAKMEMTSRIIEVAEGSEIVVTADVDLAGKLVRFGRGMMEGISKQLFKQFAERLRAALSNEEQEEEEEPKEEEAETEKKEADEKATDEKAADEKEAQEEPPSEEARSSTETAPETETEPQRAAEPPSKAAEPKVALAPADNAPLDAGSLFWSALWDWIKGLFRSLFGKNK